MNKIDYKTYIDGVKNDLKIAIDDVFSILENLAEQVEEIKKSKSDK